MSATRDYYLAQAAINAREAQATNLDRVRERCLRAEAAWQAMADRIAKTERLRDDFEAMKAERALQARV